MVARFKVAERHIGVIKERTAKGAVTVEVRVHAYPRRVFSGKVVRVAPGLEAASRTVAVEAEVANPDNLLMPGMYARVKFDLGARENALLLPLSALVERQRRRTRGGGQKGPEASYGAQTRVFVVEQGKARMVNVTLGVRNARFAEVITGLSEGVSVVIDGKETVRDGNRVRVVSDSPGNKPKADAKAANGHKKDPRRGTL